MQTKVPISQKVSIILAALSYMLTIYSLFTQETLVVLIFFILHSVFTLYSIYMAFLTRADTSEFQAMSDKIVNLNREKSDIEEQLRESLAQKEAEITQLSESLSRADSESKIADRKSRQLMEDYNNLTKNHQESINYNILPPLAEDGDASVIDVTDTVKDVIARMEKYTGGANLTVSLSATDETIRVRADRNRLEIVFQNIIDNAVKFSKKAGNLVITISTVGEDAFIVLKDNGEGMNESEAEHIFELNYQGSNHLGGTGLGLAQARSIIRSLGGSIYAKTSEGRGMGVYIQLPCADI